MRPQLTDEELIGAIEQKAERLEITTTEAIRLAIRNFCKGDMDIEENDHPSTRTIDLLEDKDMRSVHRSLWRIGSSNGCADDLRKVPLSSAKSVVAQLMGVSKEVIQEMYIKPLSRKQITDLEFGSSTAMLYVVDPDATVVDDPDALNEFGSDNDDNDDQVTNDSDFDDKMAEIDAAEPVRADGGSVDTDKSGEE